jgi:replicative DNA helicase
MSSELDLVVLKTLLTNKKHALDFASEGDPKIFSPDVWNFAQVILGYVKTYKDLPTLKVVVERLSKGNNEKLVETIKTIWSQIDNVSHDDREYKHNLEKLKKRFAEKQIKNIQESLAKFDPSSMDIGKAIKDMQQTVQSIKGLNQVRSYDRKTLKEAIPTFKEEYNAKIENPNFDTGIKTGYSYLDFATDGLRPGELVLIGGESGGGKSMLLMNMAVQMWLQQNTLDTPEESFGPGNSVLYFSLEMPFRPCLNRVLARLSGNPSKLIRNAKLDSDQAEKLKKSLRFIKKYPYEFEIVDIPRGATMEQLEMIFEEAKAHYDPKIIVIDYLGLMEYDGGKDMDDWLKLGKISEKIHEFARVHNRIVLSAVQLNRMKGAKDEDKIGLHRVGRSALILTNANIAIQIESRQNEKQYPDMKYHLIKNRDGELGNGVLIKNLSCGTLLDSKTEEDDTQFEMRDPDDISDKIDRLDDI